MAAVMTSHDVTWRRDPSKLYHLIEQAKGFLLNANLFRGALFHRKSWDGAPSPPPPLPQPLPCTTVGV